MKREVTCMENNIEKTSDIRLAVLIDADNISHHNIQGMMEEIARYGNATIKRIYGDWTRPNLGRLEKSALGLRNNAGSAVRLYNREKTQRIQP